MPASATDALPDTAPALSPHAALRRIAGGQPLTVPPTLSVRDTLLRLDARGIDALTVVDADSGTPLGIVTLRDVLHRVALVGGDLEAPIAGVMTGGVITLPADASVHQASVLMLRRGVHHLVLLEDDGRFYDLVSRIDLYAFPGSRSDALVGRIAAAREVPTLVALADETRQLSARLLAEGISAEALCQYISALNDLLSLQLIDLLAGQFELPYVPWCWLVFGSEGRLEQTLATDQDNGLVFLVDDQGDAARTAAETERLRQLFLPFARAVNEALDACGFPLCAGNIMASNPALCLSLAEWQQHFGGWMHEAEPAALLNAAIFFDFRPLYGDEHLAGELRASMLRHAPSNSLFLRAMAHNALNWESPLGPLGGWLQDFRYDKDAAHPHTIDLKKHGSRPFVDCARIFALEFGIAATNTAERLRLVAEQLGMPTEETTALIEALFHIQRLRLKQQIAQPEQSEPNRVDPDRLHELDRHILKEAFKQAKRLEQRLQLRFQL
jgi:CBS domain-containing protein